MKKPDMFRTAFQAYAVEDQVGEGANSVVYRACTEDESVFAVKVLKSEKTTRKRMLRFENEYRFCSATRHPNIVCVLDYGIHVDDAPFFVMHLYEGSLRSLIGRIEPDTVLRLFSKILDGLEAAHLKGVAHRDLKPENVLVNGEGIDVVVADFGIAAFHDEELYEAVETDSRERLGSFQYAAPEQRIRGASVGELSDIYSLGLILNELYTGQLALAQNYKTIGGASAEHSFLDPIVNRMLQQEPEARYASIADLKGAIALQVSEAESVQKLNRLQEQVIPVGEIDDPLVLDPLSIIGKDWNEGMLSIRLSQPVTEKWQTVLARTPGLSYYPGLEPARYGVRGDQVVVVVGSQMAKRAYAQFVEWLPTVRKAYEQAVSTELRTQERARKQRLECEREKEQERLRVLRELEGG